MPVKMKNACEHKRLDLCGVNFYMIFVYSSKEPVGALVGGNHIGPNLTFASKLGTCLSGVMSAT